MMGGIATDVHGFTDIPRLFACGECASYGVHGANRLASNSILDGLVFGKRSAEAMAQIQPVPDTLQQRAINLPASPLAAASPDIKPQIAELMWKQVGIIRNGDSLREACQQLEQWHKQLQQQNSPDLEALETANMLQAGWLIARTALYRQESRGAHYRTDFPNTAQQWHQHLLVRRSESGQLTISERPVQTADPG